jgi:ubiquinone/menaquinone biosynthesis C-methylase UbiE
MAAALTGAEQRSPQAHQEQVNAHFDAAASYWQAVYDDPRLQGVIYRERQRAVLQRVDELSAPAGAPVLEIGCGAGFLTLALASRGYAVRAVDASDAMVDLAAARLHAAGLTGNVSTHVADVHELPFADGAFSLVVAVGVLPWLDRPAHALQEVARVLEPAGTLILTADNRARLNSFVDPRASPLLAPIKRLRRSLRRPAARGASQRMHFPSHVNALLRGAGFRVERVGTVGFGPFSIWSHEPLTDGAAIRLHERLQALADRGVPVLRSTGWHYLVSARRRHR